MPRTSNIAAIIGAGIACAALVAFSTSSRAQIVTNGSFEEAAPGGSLPTGNGISLPTGSTAIEGWTVTGGLPSDGLAWGPEGSYGLSTPFGSYFVDLTGYFDQKPYFGIEQTISTTVGQNYALTFDLGANISGIYAGPAEVDATAGGTSQDFTTDPTSGTGTQWQGFTLDFTATSSSTLISFVGEEANTEFIGLDNVAVNTPAAGVPEPASFMLLGTALIGFRLARRRRKTVKATNFEEATP